jgi:hypothetical protein
MITTSNTTRTNPKLNMITTSNTTIRNPNHSKNTDSKITEIEHSPPSKGNEKGKVMAVVAMAKYGNAHHHKSSNRATKEKLS